MISDKAYIAPGAKIGKNVTIYPFAYIEDDVVIGDDCIIFPYVSIMKGTVMGHGNKVYQNTVLGAEPQDFNYKGDETRLVIGDENIFRENVVVNRATFKDGETRIGNRNFFMEGVHISHDTKIDDYVTFGYGTKVAGDCVWCHHQLKRSHRRRFNGDQRCTYLEGRAPVYRRNRQPCTLRWR